MRINHTIISTAAAALLLVGAGCQGSPLRPVPTGGNPASSETRATAAETPEAVEEAADRDAAETSLPDPNAQPKEDWNTYTARDKSFAFDWPSRGRYAPRWETGLLAKDDDRLESGCIKTAGEPKRLVANGTEFCQSGTLDREAGTATDYFLTGSGDSLILLTFTKDSGQTPTGFSWDEYQAQLKEIVSTFRYLN